MAQPLICPWCGYEDTSEASIQYHIEEQHTEDSPFVTRSALQHDHARSTSSSLPEDGSPRLECTRPGCGQLIQLKDIEKHLKHHDQSGAPYDDRRSRDATSMSKSGTPKDKTPASRSKGKSSTGSLLSFFSKRSTNVSSLGSEVKKARLGREELGDYAFEKAMPSSVRKALETAERPITQTRITSAGKLAKVTSFPNETSGLIDVLASICDMSNTTKTFLCHRSTKHIHLVKCDGNFCGYWNIQMLVSYVLAMTKEDRGLPTVMQIQETIEAAWDEGICAYGKIETGGIYNTRKWIGTHEALAFFTKLGLTISAASFKDDKETGRHAYEELLDFVEAYFLPMVEEDANICTVTDRPPIYLQRAGHSITVIGIQRRKSGKRNLIVFDPSHKTAPAMIRLLDRASIPLESRELLEPYLRPERRLGSWHEYEVLVIDSCEGLKLPGG